MSQIKKSSFENSYSLAFSNDSKYIIIGTGNNDCSIHVYNTVNFELLWLLKGHDDYVFDV